ncbi:MAG: VWA domain-containing protein [Caldilineaceae bacterium]
MRTRHFWLLASLSFLVAALAFLLLFPAAHASAGLEIAPAAPAADSAAQGVDVVVVLDDSGSMATCWPWPQSEPPFYPPCRAPSTNEPSDPNDLRYSAARLLVQLADEDDRIAVIRFDTAAEGVGAMGSLQRVGTDVERQQLIQSLQPPTDYFRRGYTRIDLGLQTAMDLLAQSRESGRNQYIVLLTDGEPTHPGGPEGVKADIARQVETLIADDVLTFPVVLCNPTAGCQGEFLREQFADFGVDEATTAESLLRVFSDIFAQMKPDRSVISSKGQSVRVSTRAPQSVRSMSFVTGRDGLLALTRDDEPVPLRTTLDDPNIDVSVLDAATQNEGQWAAQVAESGGFVVVRADSYPELVSPPPSVAESPASVRYYPAGTTPLLIARGVGPAANEPLLYNGQLPMEPFGQSDLRFLLPSDVSSLVRLQLGEDGSPLQLARSFRVEPREGLPNAVVISPAAGSDGRVADGKMRLEVGLRGGEPASDIHATVYVFDMVSGANGGDNRTLVYTASMACGDRTCTDESFLPEDGRTYEVMFVVDGEVKDLRFGDWVQTTVGLEPAIYLRGLPSQLDLAQMPDGGWPVELASGTVEEIGLLSADISLRDVETGETVKDVTLDFMPDVPEEGSLSTALRIDGLDTLRPGEYEGEIKLEARSPSGLPMNVRIRPAPEIPLTLSVARPLARVRSQALDFGDILFDTSPNFRLDEEAYLTVDFSGDPFPLTAELVSDNCSELSIVAGDAQSRLGQTVVPLHLTSPRAIQPGSCTGTIRLSGPDEYHDITPASVDWQVHVADVEWSIVDGNIDLGDLQDAGKRVEETLRVRFSGKTPFLLEMEDIQAVGSNLPEGAPTALASDYIDMPPVEVDGPPLDDGTYLVPVTLIARQAIPHDALRGSFYTGQLGLRVAGLDDAAKPLDIAFRSPSLYQRYLAPIIVPVYSLPWVLCTAPLTLLLLLVIIARTRGRGFDQDEVEQEAMAKAVKTVAVDPAAEPKNEPIVPTPMVAPTSVWGNSEWGGAFGGHTADSGEAKSATTNGHAKGPAADPWSSSW